MVLPPLFQINGNETNEIGVAYCEMTPTISSPVETLNNYAYAISNTSPQFLYSSSTPCAFTLDRSAIMERYLEITLSFLTAIPLHFAGELAVFWS